MPSRTVNVIVSFLEPDAEPVPFSTVYNISTFGYKSPDDPYWFAPPRLKSNVTFEKSIGTVYWGNKSSINFGNIDIAINDNGVDEIGGAEVRWVEWAKANLNPQVLISVEQTDGTLLHIATADAEDVFFPDDSTIRVQLIAKHQRALEVFLNDYFDDTYDADVRGLPVPIYLGAGPGGGPSSSYDPSTYEPVEHVPTLLVDDVNLRYVVANLDWVSISPSAYFVMDRGVVLREGENPGFTLWENGFELTSNPDGTITFASMTGQGSGVEDPYESGEILQGAYRITRWAVGKAGIDIDLYFPSFSEFPELAPAGFNERNVPLVYYASEVSARTLLNDVILNLSAWWYVDELGVFRFGLLEDPDAVPPVVAYSDVEMIGGISARVDRAPGLSSIIRHRYSPGAYDASNIAGSVTVGRRRRLSQEWQQRVTTAPIPLTYEPNRGNPPMTLYSGGQNTQDALDEINRRWTDYYAGIRRFYSFRVPLFGNVTLPELGDVVTIESERAELLEYGALPVLIRRMKFDLGAGLLDIEGWGGETAAPPVEFLTASYYIGNSSFTNTTSYVLLDYATKTVTRFHHDTTVGGFTGGIAHGDNRNACLVSSGARAIALYWDGSDFVVGDTGPNVGNVADDILATARMGGAYVTSGQPSFGHGMRYGVFGSGFVAPVADALWTSDAGATTLLDFRRGVDIDAPGWGDLYVCYVQTGQNLALFEMVDGAISFLDTTRASAMNPVGNSRQAIWDRNEGVLGSWSGATVRLHTIDREANTIGAYQEYTLPFSAACVNMLDGFLCAFAAKVLYIYDISSGTPVQVDTFVGTGLPAFGFNPTIMEVDPFTNWMLSGYYGSQVHFMFKLNADGTIADTWINDVPDNSHRFARSRYCANSVWMAEPLEPLDVFDDYAQRAGGTDPTGTSPLIGPTPYAVYSGATTWDIVASVPNYLTLDPNDAGPNFLIYGVGSADVEVSLGFNIPGAVGIAASVVARFVDENNFIQARLYVGGTSNLTVSKVVGGMTTTLFTDPDPVAGLVIPTNDIAIRIKGTDVTVVYNSIKKWSGTIDDAALNNATDHGLMQDLTDMITSTFRDIKIKSF